jgi:hypothetical protein
MGSGSGPRAPGAVTGSGYIPGRSHRSGSTAEPAAARRWCGDCDRRTRLLGFDGDAPHPVAAREQAGPGCLPEHQHRPLAEVHRRPRRLRPGQRGLRAHRRLPPATRLRRASREPSLAAQRAPRTGTNVTGNRCPSLGDSALAARPPEQPLKATLGAQASPAKAPARCFQTEDSQSATGSRAARGTSRTQKRMIGRSTRHGPIRHHSRGIGVSGTLPRSGAWLHPMLRSGFRGSREVVHRRLASETLRFLDAPWAIRWCLASHATNAR